MRKTEKFWAAALFAVLGGALACLFRPGGGLMLTHDSLAYLHAAGTFTRGEGFLYFGYGTPMIQWPLLPSLIYGLLGQTTPAVSGFMLFLNFPLLAGALFFANLLAAELIENRLLRTAAMGALSLSAWVMRVYYYLWSECLFLLFTAALLYFITVFLRSGGLPRLLAAAVCAGLALWSRFTGMELVGLCGLALLLEAKPLKARVKNAALFGGVAALPYAGLLLRNYLLSGTLTGRSRPSVTPFGDNVRNTAESVARWLIPDGGKAAYAALAAALILLAVCVWKLLRVRRSPGLPLLLLGAHCVAYPCLIIYSNTFYALDPIGFRMLAPLLFCAVILFLSLAGLTGWKKIRPALAAGAAAVCLLNLLYAARTGPDLTGYYVSSQFRDDPLIAYASTLKDAKIYTNRPAEMYYMTGLDINYPPRREGAEPYLWPACMERLGEKELYVIWYDGATNPVLYQLEELKDRLELTPVESFPQGGVWRASR